MMPMWSAMAALSLLAAAFILWPLWRHRKQLQANNEVDNATARLEENIALFREHMRDLDNALAEGRIDDAQHAQLKLEQERTLLDDEASVRVARSPFTLGFGSKSLVFIAVLIIACGFLLYRELGSSADVHIQQLQAEKSRLDYQDLLHNRNPDPARTRAFIRELEDRVEQEPDNLQYWFLLARNALEVADYAKAVTAYQRTLALDPGAAIVMAELAQAMFLRDKNQMSPAIAELALKALQADARNTTALGLAGINAFQQKDFRTAARYWQQAVDIMGPDAPGARALQGGVARAQQEAANQPAGSEPAASGKSISLRVSLAEGVDAAGDQLVYVYARAWQGSRMPLAITRINVADLPATIILDETMAMSTMASLAQADQVEVVARISEDGTATAKPGDWQVSVGPLDMDALPETTELVIAEKLTE
ncbi:MAG TPA: c-type cytochrome biogenesis protein CcmI [Cellvibrio sp.]|nr:c-type cytochrome biogenesis protein CcmI [Cellvibrio sp.]